MRGGGGREGAGGREAVIEVTVGEVKMKKVIFKEWNR